MNPLRFIQLKSAWEQFKKNHPKFPRFVQASSQYIQEGTVIEFRITAKDGREITSNVKLKESDILLFQELKELFL